MRILFIGSVDFSRATLEKMIDLKTNLVGVVCKKSSLKNSDFYDIGEIAIQNNISAHYTENINSLECETWIKNLSPDVIFCFGWSHIIRANILNLAPMGIIGFHPAQLPNNRGRHPLIWALFLGLHKTASTFFFMDSGTDTGDILSQKEIMISDSDDAQSLYQKVTEAALKQIEEFLPKLKDNTFQKIPQNKKNGNAWRRRNIMDGKIDWRMSSKAIFNLVRAITRPYVGAHITINEKNYKVWKVEIVKSEIELQNIEPGKILDVDYGKCYFDVKTYDGIIRVLQHDVDNLSLIGEYLQ